jgi:hypothetical protein
MTLLTSDEPFVARTLDAPSRLLALGEDVDEHDHEQQVDEVHRLDQSDGQEEVRAGLVLDLGLTRDRRDGLATGQAVTDRRTDGAATEGDAAADECTRDADRTCDCLCAIIYSSWLVLLRSLEYWPLRRCFSSCSSSWLVAMSR